MNASVGLESGSDDVETATDGEQETASGAALESENEVAEGSASDGEQSRGLGSESGDDGRTRSEALRERGAGRGLQVSRLGEQMD